MQVALCDDNELFLRELEEQVKAVPLVSGIRSFSNWKDFCASMEEGRTYDAVLMDIDLADKKTGIDMAEALYHLTPETKIIYVTGYTERFVQQVFLHKANLSGYLTKPVDGDLLRANLQKVADSMNRREEETLLIRADGALTSIAFGDIRFIESRSHTILIHTEEKTFVSYEKLSNLMQKLPPNFCRCHKSFLVNMRQIQRFQYASILLKNGEQIPVSRARYAQTRECYFRFMGHEV